MKKKLLTISTISAIAIIPIAIVSCSNSGDTNTNPEKPNVENKYGFSYQILEKVTKEIPKRLATSPEDEKGAANWIKSQLKSYGYRQISATNASREWPQDGQGTTINVGSKTVRFNLLTNEEKVNDLKEHGFYESKFVWTSNGTSYQSQNLMLNIISEKENAKDIFITSHYDTANPKNDGTNDNSSGVATSLAVAQYFANQKNIANLNVNIHILFAGAEEVGVLGTNAWVNQYLKDTAQIKDKTLWMLNLDSVAGGDHLYVHSPDTKNVSEGQNTAHDIRDAFNKISNKKLEIHPQLDPAGFKAGETGDWSDHAPFYKNGIEIAYIESTNFNIKGKDGYDGYSQTINEIYWKKADGTTVKLNEEKIGDHTVYIPENYEQLKADQTFTSWGKLWHMDDDRFENYQTNFPGRLQEQMAIVLKAVIEQILATK